MAVLTKKNLCEWESKQKVDGGQAEVSNDKNRHNGKEPPKKKARMYQGFKEDPFIYFGSDEPIFKEISEYYGLQQELKSQMFLTRCKDTTKKNTLYYTTEIVRDIVQSNEDKVKIINTGVKVQIEIILLQCCVDGIFFILHHICYKNITFLLGFYPL